MVKELRASEGVEGDADYVGSADPGTAYAAFENEEDPPVQASTYSIDVCQHDAQGPAPVLNHKILIPFH